MYYANVNVTLMEERVFQSKTGITINANNASVKISYMWKRLYVKSWYMSCKNGKYLASITGDLVIADDEIIEKTKAVQQISIKRK